ncbi:MAG TPA: porin, partial [Ramlibacter sp.]|nr:porin [Ramlibacter sp.]
MKKSLIALAVLATAGVASAQSSVTLFGIVDATLAFGKGDTTDKTQLTNSGYNSSRLGFRGTEDLGGGMSASFWLEAGLANDDGQGAATSSNNQPSGTGAAVAGRQGLTFNRRSTVSLAGGWGEVRLGRDYTPQFWNLTVFDPFGTNGVGTTLTLISGQANTDPVTIRASNSIGYFLPGNLGGFYGQAQYYMGENPSQPSANEDDGMGGGVRVGFASGPFNVAGAFSRTNFAAGDFKTWNVGGQWDFGFAKLMAQYVDHKLQGPAIDLHGKGWLIGGLVPVGAGEIRLSYSAYDYGVASAEAKKYALGYVHNLSKRTALYATYAHLSNDGAAALSLNGSTTPAGGSSSG